jgi:hypothetical protein
MRNRSFHFLGACTVAAVTAAFAMACADQPTAVLDERLGPGDADLGVTSTPNQQDWRQCRNDNDRESECNWITGNLNATHNTYFEGDMVPKVLRIPSIVGTGSFDVVMTYGVSKGGKTTHDFLGKWNLDMINANPCQGAGGRYASFCNGTALGSLHAITGTSNSMATLSMQALEAACAGHPNYADAVEAMDQAITGAGGPGNLVIEAIGFDEVTVTEITWSGCPFTGDVEAELKINVKPSGAYGSEALLLFGAHVARGYDWPNGGAGDVSGSPYHLGLVSVDGRSAGSMDLQMAAAAIIVPGSITIEKVCTAGEGTFEYTGTVPGGGALEPFSLDCGDSEVIVEGTDFGQYTITEDVPTGWELTDLECDPATGTSTDLGTATATVNLTEGQHYVCTFTNSPQPQVRVRKEFDPDTDDGLVEFVVGGNADDNETDGYGHGGETDWYYFNIGDDVSFSEAGFDGTDLDDYESSWACDNGASGTGTSGSTGELDAGDAVTCTFTNARKPEVRVRKLFDPTDDGGKVEFDVGGNADHNETNGYGHTGTTDWYQFNIGDDVNFSEDGFGGTDLANYTSTWECDNGASGNGTSGSTGELVAGDQVTCTFTNTLIPVATCEAGDRVTSVTLEVILAGPPDQLPLRIDVTDDNGPNYDVLLRVDPATVGTIFTVDPEGGATFFDSQNLRFALGPSGGPATMSSLKVHLSCSDDPEVGDLYSGSVGVFSVTLKLLALSTTTWP